MVCTSSYRIGNRATPANNNAITSESTILRSLLELRKSYNGHSSSQQLQLQEVRVVTDITFWNCQWTPRITQSLRKLFVRDCRCFSSIKLFDCGINDNNTIFAEILNMILANNATTSLVIKGGKLIGASSNNNNESSDGPLSQLCESSLPSSSVDVSILLALREGISTNTSLKSLKLSSLNFTSATTTITTADDDDDDDDDDNVDNDSYQWCQSLINNNTLRHLDLSDSHLSTSTLSGLSNALPLNTALQYLNLGRCYLDDQSLSQVLRSVKEHPSLTELNISRNYLAKSASTLAVDAVAELLRSNSSRLICLDLSHQQRPRPQQKIITPTPEVTANEKEAEEQRHKVAFANALDALSTNATLQRIDLSGNSGCFADLTSVEALSACLVANKGLYHLDVSSCDLTPIGVQYLAQMCLPHCGGRLKSLVLFGDGNYNNNSITEKKEEDRTTLHTALESGLQSNATLESLGELDDATTASKLSSSSNSSSIQHSLNLNRAGRRAFRTDDLPLAAWSHILARAGRIEYDNEDEYDDEVEVSSTATTATTASVLFTLLQGPALLEQRR